MNPPGDRAVPESLVRPLVHAVAAGVAALERRHGGPPGSADQLLTWCRDLARSSVSGLPPDTLDPAGPGWCGPDRCGTAEAAGLLGVSQHQVTVLVRQRWLDGQRVGRLWVLQRRQVIELAGRRANGTNRQDP